MPTDNSRVKNNQKKIEHIDCRCGSTNLKRHGKYKGETLYKCRDCNATFTRVTRYNKLWGTSQMVHRNKGVDNVDETVNVLNEKTVSGRG